MLRHFDANISTGSANPRPKETSAPALPFFLGHPIHAHTVWSRATEFGTV